MSNSLNKNIAVSSAGLLFNPVNGESFSVNPIGISILNYLHKGKSSSEICNLLVEEFNVEPETAERDLLDFVNLLRHYQLTDDDDKKSN